MPKAKKKMENSNLDTYIVTMNKDDVKIALKSDEEKNNWIG